MTEISFKTVDVLCKGNRMNLIWVHIGLESKEPGINVVLLSKSQLKNEHSGNNGKVMNMFILKKPLSVSHNTKFNI